MRKVTFKIDDLAFFKKHYNLTDEQMQDIFSDKESFKVIYTLIGERKNIDKYELMDYAGNKISINDLNGYEKGVVLNDCCAYFTGGKYHSNAKVPCGVVDIKEEEVKKFYRVEIVYTASLGLKSGNSFIDYLAQKPESTTEHFPMKDLHKAWFENPVEAEEYRQKCLLELS